MLAVFPLASNILKLPPAAKPDRQEDRTAMQTCELATTLSFDSSVIDKMMMINNIY